MEASPKPSPSFPASPLPHVGVKRPGTSPGQTLLRQAVVWGPTGAGTQHPALGGVGGLGVLGKRRPRETMLGQQISAPLNAQEDTEAPKRCCKMARFGASRGGGFGGAGAGVLAPLPFPALPEQPADVGHAVPAFHLNGFDFCGFVSPFMFIK